METAMKNLYTVYRTSQIHGTDFLKIASYNSIS